MNASRAAIIFILIASIGTSLWWWMGFPAGTVTVTIPPGASARTVADMLKKERVISSKTLFLQAAVISGSIRHLKAGTYRVSPRASMFSVLNTLAHGKAEYVKVTIPEGFSAQQVADALETRQVVDGKKFMSLAAERKLEGYLYPETYFFEQFMKEEQVAGRMVAEFRKHYTPELAARAAELKMTEAQVVTLASIIEKEAAAAAERPLISGVFHNRLRKRWYLESCPTVMYALGGHKERLTLADTRVNSPYNTYQRPGLPPGPICNPGIDSIKAALYPAQTEDMFFVAGSSGTHMFSRYYSEHLKNKRSARRKPK